MSVHLQSKSKYNRWINGWKSIRWYYLSIWVAVCVCMILKLDYKWFNITFNYYGYCYYYHVCGFSTVIAIHQIHNHTMNSHINFMPPLRKHSVHRVRENAKICIGTTIALHYFFSTKAEWALVLLPDIPQFYYVHIVNRNDHDNLNFIPKHTHSYRTVKSWNASVSTMMRDILWLTAGKQTSLWTKFPHSIAVIVFNKLLVKLINFIHI